MLLDWNSTGISQRFVYELQEFCLKDEHIDKVILFGSRARGDYRRTSDIDLAMYTCDSSHSQQNLIEQSIQEMSTPLKIDVLFMDRLTKEQLVSNILRDGRIIYEKGTALRKA